GICCRFRGGEAADTCRLCRDAGHGKDDAGVLLHSPADPTLSALAAPGARRETVSTSIARRHADRAAWRANAGISGYVGLRSWRGCAADGADGKLVLPRSSLLVLGRRCRRAEPGCLPADSGGRPEAVPGRRVVSTAAGRPRMAADPCRRRAAVDSHPGDAARLALCGALYSG